MAAVPWSGEGSRHRDMWNPVAGEVTLHQDRRRRWVFVRNLSTAVADELNEGIESPMPTAMMDFFAIMVSRRVGAMSVRPC